MQTDIPNLFIEINHSNYIFVAGIYDDSQNFKIIEKIVVPNEGINKNRFTNIDQAKEAIKALKATRATKVTNLLHLRNVNIAPTVPNQEATQETGLSSLRNTGMKMIIF